MSGMWKDYLESGDGQWAVPFGTAPPFKLPSYIVAWRMEGKKWMEENDGSGKHDVKDKLAKADKRVQLCVQINDAFLEASRQVKDDGRSRGGCAWAEGRKGGDGRGRARGIGSQGRSAARFRRG